MQTLQEFEFAGADLEVLGLGDVNKFITHMGSTICQKQVLHAKSPTTIVTISDMLLY